MKLPTLPNPTRRNFLRNVAAVAAVTPALAMETTHAQQNSTAVDGRDISLLSRISIDKNIYEHNEILKGSLSFSRKPIGSIVVQWIDSFGRVAAEKIIAAPVNLATSVPFSFDLRIGLTYMNSICVKVNGATQAVAARFSRSPAASAWNDYQIISWAYYPDGYYDQLRKVGVNGTIAYREGDFSQVLDNNFNFYVEQTLWEVYANYHKDLAQWRDVISKVRADRSNLDHWIRKPCLNDPATQTYIRERLELIVRLHRDFRPLYYTISDELGQGDQISANDFCHSVHCTVAFSEYLRKSYASIQDLRKEWELGEVIRWDDEGIRSGAEWEKANLMITRTTTDAAFEAIGLANLQARYGTVKELNRTWGTTFPEPRGGGMGAREIWEPILGAVRESLSILDMNEAALEKALGPLEQFNIRCGNRAGWNAPQEPTNFKTWTEVKTFLIRYDKELGEVSSTKGWNAAPWSDFRNFMDTTFADAVQRAGAICKAEDPYARCATEGGQAPFAFGWYNYEQVVRVVDVIEPYNIGNNVEIVRSLKPETIMLSTVGFDHKPGTPMTPDDRLRQHQAVRPVWWELFHSHQGTLIWDNQEEPATFVNLKTGELQIPAETFKDVFLEIRSGLGMLAMNCARTQDGIAIHYSHPSVQAHWLLENAKRAREWMVHTVEAYVTSRFIAVRNSWTKLIEDLQVQYDFVSATQVASGDLNSGKYRVFILPESIALSAAEADQIREFVRSGGTVIADFRTALLNEHCRDIGSGQLNDVFGIGEDQPRAASSTEATAADSLQLATKNLSAIAPAEPALVATTGKPLVHNGNAPMVVLSSFGKGRAVYLNMDLSGYAFDRLNPKASGAIPELLDALLASAQIRPRVRVLGADGKRLPGTEVVIFKNGACEQVVIFRNPQLDDGGWGIYREKKSNWRDWTTDADNSAFEKDEAVTISWDSSTPTYDVRGQKDLGAIAEYKTTLNPWEPLVFTRASHSLPGLNLSVPSTCIAGSTLEVATTADSHPEGTLRVVHFDFVKPSGETCELYARNEMVTSVPHSITIPIACNDPVGHWIVKAHDLMTGQHLEASFNVQAS